ncbi:MAG: hypothetical protein JNM93_11680 [Bacteriovoracaceae bacterium]|nr:hypothetical protein [Bacteriovoracaceae bacterium]
MIVEDYTDPRSKGRKAVQDTVDASTWEKNRRFSENLKAILAKHPIASHPLMEFFDNETLNNAKTLAIHQEFGYAFAQIFTDGVIRAMSLSQDLEARLGPKGKVTARFLWALNLMDELGYVPSGDTESYSGNPYAAHYFLYVDIFRSLGASERAILDFKPAEESKLARATFENQYNNYADLTAVLAISESIFDKFAGPWARNVGRSSQVDSTKGYHTIHVEDHDGESIDDEHSEDGWTLFCQAVTPDDYTRIEKLIKNCLNDWSKFADKIIDIAMS